MAAIEKLSIRGIRSFNPSRDETIEFYSPLTIIVGANGCGKTSIIESLKYACTGALPPTCSNGQSFINDPTMTNATEVKASVKLRFSNKAGKPSVVVRSVQLTKKKTKMEFKALDGVIRTTNENQETVSTSHKCTELDKQVPEMMGVSAAIMDNVIFCHQEDSSWPMSEGILLKKKFDDVFESTRYTKALEAFAKSKKEFANKAKDLKGEMLELGAYLQSSNETKEEIEACEESKQFHENELESVLERLERNEARLLKCQEMVANANIRSGKMQEAKWKLEEASRRFEEKKEEIGQPMSESDDELDKMLENFELEMQARSKRLSELQKLVDSTNREVSVLRGRTDGLNTLRGQATSLLDQIEVQKKETGYMMEQFGRTYSTYDLHPPQSDHTNSSIQSVNEYAGRMGSKINQLKVEENSALNTAKEEVKKREGTLSQIKTQIQGLTFELDAKSAEYQTVGGEIGSKQTELSTLSNARLILSQTERDYLEAKSCNDEFATTFNTTAQHIKKKIKDTGDSIRSLSEQMSNDSDLLQSLNMNRKEISELQAAERQLVQESMQLVADTRSVFLSHRSVTEVGDIASAQFSNEILENTDGESVLGTSNPSAELKRLSPIIDKISISASEKKKSLKDLRDNLAAKRSETGGLTALLKNSENRLQIISKKVYDGEIGTREELNKIINDIMELRKGELLLAEFEDVEELSKECSLEQLITAVEETENVATRYEGFHLGRSHFKKKIVKARTKKNGACPCCEREMDSVLAAKYEINIENLFKSTFAENNELLKATQDQARNLVSRVKNIESLLRPLSALKSEREECTLKITDLKEKEREAQRSAASFSAETESAELAVAAIESALSAVTILQTRWQSISNRQFELEERRRRQSQSLSMAGEDNSRSIDEIEEEQRKRSDKKDDLLSKKEKYIAEESQLIKKSNQLNVQMLERERVYSDARRKGARQSDLELSLRNLHTQSTEIEARKREIKNQRDNTDRQLEIIQREVALAKKESKEIEDSWGLKISNLTNDRDGLIRSLQGLEKLSALSNKSDLNSVLSQLKSIHAEIELKEDGLRTHHPQITALNAELLSSDNTKRLIKDNKEMRECERERERLQDVVIKMVEEENRVGGNGEGGRERGSGSLKDAERELLRGQQEKEKLSAESAAIGGKLEIYDEKFSDLKAKLNGPTYKGVGERHRKKTIEFETTSLAVVDLGSYYDALDRALQNFHTLKIKEINKIIRELWQLVYKGQDIDMIELESGQDASTAGVGVGSIPAKGSRSYNYRVVMRKGDVPLDMRGRCSAGQRVLAAIVIRLALAETFCLNCGILALDEPTTNLDEANKSGLAHALSRIILNRQRQHNFQLVCITHDEDFVRLISTQLSSSAEFSMPEFYFRISREEENDTGKYFSRIERIRWEDM